jgi:uncharacterized protein (TIGR02284 family)
MAISNRELVDILVDLRETNVDRQKTYEAASDNISDTRLRNTFSNLIEQSRRFITEIERELKNLGEQTSAKGSIKGSLHRGFLEIRSAFTSNDDRVMLEESIRGEKMAVDNYDDVLNRDLPPNVQQLVSKQFGDIKQNLSELNTLKSSY